MQSSQNNGDQPKCNVKVSEHYSPSCYDLSLAQVAI